jgi:hypothetical protein
MGLRGLWIGLTVALGYTAVLTVGYLCFINWNAVAAAARERLEAEGVIKAHVREETCLRHEFEGGDDDIESG